LDLGEVEARLESRTDQPGPSGRMFASAICISPWAPILLGTGENFFAGLDSPVLRYAGFDRVSTPGSIRLIVTNSSNARGHPENLTDAVGSARLRSS
jgi:hypothetical protein